MALSQRQIDILQHDYTLAHAVGRCLHVGCGMKRIPNAVNLDPNPERWPWSNVAGEGLRLPFADRTFDSLVSSHVLNFFPNINVALREFARVLVVGGVMAHVVPDWRYAPNRLASHWRFERQAQGWQGPEAFRAALHNLSDVLQFTCIDAFREHTWSFKVEAVRI